MLFWLRHSLASTSSVFNGPRVPQVARMLAENDWIESERHIFGQPNTAYDFKANNPKEAGQRLRKLEETKEKLERNVNMRAMNMLSQAEEKVCLCLHISVSLWLAMFAIVKYPNR